MRQTRCNAEEGRVLIRFRENPTRIFTRWREQADRLPLRRCTLTWRRASKLREA